MATMNHDRREFLEKAAWGSAGLALGVGTRAAEGRATLGERGGAPYAPYAVLDALAPGEIEPEGWLKLYLQRQASALGTHLPQVSWPFTGDYWAGEEHYPSKTDSAGPWWPWEQKGYYIDGSLRCALVLADERLLEAARAPVEYTLAHAAQDGYLGPRALRESIPEEAGPHVERWPHAVFFRALAVYAEGTRDARVAQALKRHFLGDASAPYGDASRNVVNVEAMLWGYRHTGDPRLLAMAERAWADFLDSAPPADYESGDLHPKRVFANTTIHAHGVTYIEKAKLPAILYMHTGKAEYLRYALAAQERIFCHHMLIDGVPSTTEEYRETSSLDAHETCDISDHTWSWGYLLMATGEARWADRIERACFNAGFGAIRKDWKALQYFSCPNQVLATSHSDHTYVAYGDGTMAFRPNPGHGIACCAGNVHRIFPNYVLRMWMRDAHGGLVAALYGASTVRAVVGSAGDTVRIDQQTDYPFAEEIHFTIRSDKAVAFPLYLRIPGWCEAPRLSLNGAPLELPELERGFVCLRRAFEPGDRITLTLPMSTAVSHWPRDGIGIEHGPLVYSLRVEADWRSEVEPKWSTEAFPEWNAMPATAWNYAIGVDERELLSSISVKRTAVPSDPWTDPPTTLIVPLKKVADWQMQTDPDRPTLRFTPQLPRKPLKNWQTVQTESVTLVPYGCTHLRVTLFPKSHGP